MYLQLFLYSLSHKGNLDIKLFFHSFSVLQPHHGILLFDFGLEHSEGPTPLEKGLRERSENRKERRKKEAEEERFKAEQEEIIKKQLLVCLLSFS